jgi:hypothetical protein
MKGLIKTAAHEALPYLGLIAMAGCQCTVQSPEDSDEPGTSAWTATTGPVLEGRIGGRAGVGLSAGDLDGDGTDELLVAAWNDASVCAADDGCVTAWLLSVPAQGGALADVATAWFSASSEALSEGGYRLQRDMAFPGDLSGDGTPDILLLADRWADDDEGYDEDSRALMLWSGPFTGEVAREDAVALFDPQPGVRDHTPCDIDGDGQPDLCTSGGMLRGPIEGARYVHQLECRFTNDYFWYQDGVSGFVEAGDVFGEGVDAMVRSHYSIGWEDEGYTRTWVLGADGEPCDRRQTRGDPSGTYAVVVDGDLDGDGLEDPIVVGQEDGTRALAISHDRDRTTVLTSTLSGGSRDSALLADFDGDGQDDLAWSSAGGWVSILRGPIEGEGLTETRAELRLVGASEPACDADGCSVPDGFGRAMAAGDFDGDGRDDLAVGAPGDDDTPGKVYIAWGGGL